MSEKGGDPMSVSKGKQGFFVKLLCFVLALAAGGALGVGGTLFFQWQALPPPEEVFPYWYEPPAPVQEESGVTVTLTEANRKHTGAGTLAYTLKNDTEQPLSFPVSMRALDYLYQGEYYRIYPSPNSEGSSGEDHAGARRGTAVVLGILHQRAVPARDIPAVCGIWG